MDYHVSRDGTQMGVFTRQQLDAGIINGQLKGSDMAWTEGMEDWLPLETVLADLALKAPPSEASPPARTASVGTGKPGRSKFALIAAALAALLVAGLGLPFFNGIQERARQMQATNNARQVVVALRNYAGNHDGKFPAKLEELVQSGDLKDLKALEAPPSKDWSPEPGYDYLGAGMTTAEAGSKVILRSRFHSPDGKQIEARGDGSVTVEAPGAKP